MTLRNIAYKNMRNNLDKYVMYYLSSTLVVMVFFIFANFIYNPQVINVRTMEELEQVAARILYSCEIVILLFTVVFTNYSISNFLRSREKEFGLLSMFGLTKGEIRRYVMFENMVVSIASIATGIVFGMLFSKLFFMAIAAILRLKTEIPFSISIKGLIITILCFIVLFQVIGFKTSYKIKSNNIIELLKGERVAKPIPKFSKVKAVLAILLIAAGYAMAVYSGIAIILTMLPILITTITGTYFLYSQFSVYFTDKLHKNTKLYYKGINMITLAQIIYKLRDNAKILFMVSILGSVTLTAASTIYSVEKTTEKQTGLYSPQEVSFIENGLSTHNVIAPEKVEEIFNKDGQKVSFKIKVVLIKGVNADSDADRNSKNNDRVNKKDFYIMSNSEYNMLAKEYKQLKLNLKEDEIVVRSYNCVSTGEKKLFSDKQYLNINIAGENKKWKLKDEITGGIINTDEKGASTIVVSDMEYKKLEAKVSDKDQYVYYGYSLKDWMDAGNSVKEIKAAIPKESLKSFQERVINSAMLMQSMSLIFFIGAFIAILFFIATGSILYFKMFNELQKDRQEFVALKKMGMSVEEVKSIVSIQCFIMFFLPFVVAFSHTAFAIKALSYLLEGSLSLYLLTIVGIYFILQSIYYLFARTMYIKQINNWGA